MENIKNKLLKIIILILTFPNFALAKPSLLDSEFHYLDIFRDTWYPRIKIISIIILIMYFLISCIYFKFSKGIQEKKKKKILYWFFNVLMVILILFLSVEYYVQFELR